MKAHALFVIGLFYTSAVHANGVDCEQLKNFEKKECSCNLGRNTYLPQCLTSASCSSMKNFEIGGNLNSQFETMSCEKIIERFVYSEKIEGNLKTRMDDFAKQNKIKYTTKDECKKMTGENRRNCFDGVFKYLEKFAHDNEAFLDVLRYKIAAYDNLYQSNRSDLNCKAETSGQKFSYSRKLFNNDCEMIKLNVPKCFLKMGSVPRYSANQQAFFADRLVCKKFVDLHEVKEKYEAFKRGIEQSVKTETAKMAESIVDCSKFDSDKQPLVITVTGANLDRYIYCLTNPNANSGSALPSRAKGTKLDVQTGQ